MEINDYISKIKKLGACEGAVKEAHNYETSQELWVDCKRGDWMSWLVAQFSGEVGSEGRKKLCLCLAKQVRLSWDILPELGKKCIIKLEQWARGENNITLNDVRDAATATTYAATTYAAATAAVTAANDATVLARCADIVRTYYPNVDELWKDSPDEPKQND